LIINGEHKYFYESIYTPCFHILSKGYEKIDFCYKKITGDETPLIGVVTSKMGEALTDVSKELIKNASTDSIVTVTAATVAAATSKESIDLLNKGIINLDDKYSKYNGSISEIVIDEKYKEYLLHFGNANRITHIDQNTKGLSEDIVNFMKNGNIGSFDLNIKEIIMNDTVVNNDNIFVVHEVDVGNSTIDINRSSLNGYGEYLGTGLFYITTGTLILVFFGPAVAISSGVTLGTVKLSSLVLLKAGVTNTIITTFLPKICGISVGLATYKIIKSFEDEDNIEEEEDNKEENKINNENNE